MIEHLVSLNILKVEYNVDTCCRCLVDPGEMEIPSGVESVAPIRDQWWGFETVRGHLAREMTSNHIRLDPRNTGLCSHVVSGDMERCLRKQSLEGSRRLSHGT